VTQVERVRGLLAAMHSFDDAKAVLAEGRMLEKDAALSTEALQVPHKRALLISKKALLKSPNKILRTGKEPY